MRQMVLSFGTKAVSFNSIKIIIVPQCALIIEALFAEAGATPGLFQNFFVSDETAAKMIQYETISEAS